MGRGDAQVQTTGCSTTSACGVRPLKFRWVINTSEEGHLLLSRRADVVVLVQSTGCASTAAWIYSLAAGG